MRNVITNVILDLDETLISSVEKYELKTNSEIKKEFTAKSGNFTIHSMSSDYFITERPGVQVFLDFLFDNFNVSVWTAASKEYANFVIKKVILKNPERRLDYVMYSKHCSSSEKKTGCIKNLDKFFHLQYYNKHNTVIIDDNVNVFENQNNQVIKLKAFDVMKKDSPEDNTLESVKKTLEKMMKPRTSLA